MTTKFLKEFSNGEIVFTHERIGDDRNTMEVREVFYRREANNRPVKFDYCVPIARLGTVQGDPMSSDGARYVRILSEPCRDPGEADGRTKAQSLADGDSTWGHLLRLLGSVR